MTSFFDNLTERIQRLTPKKISGLLILFFIIIILTNGLALFPSGQYQRLSQNPFIPRTDIGVENYFQETLLLPLIAFYTNLNSPLSFNILCFFLIIVGYILFARLSFKQHGPFATLIFTSILITSPITTVLLSWMGTADGLTFVLTIPFLFITSNLLIFFLAVLGATNHIAFLIAAIEILVLRWVRSDRIKINHLVAVLTGGTIGYVLVLVFLAFNHIDLWRFRYEIIYSRNLNFWIWVNTNHFPLTFFSLFNIQWLIIFISVFMFYKMNKAFYTCVLIILLFNYGITFFTLDTTRIFSIISWGVLMECIFHSYKLAIKNSSEVTSNQNRYTLSLIILGLVSFFVPRYFAWVGEIHPSPILALITGIIK